MIKIAILLLAGIGAGLVTGFFGGSATLMGVPVLVIFGGYPPYKAVGISLAIDIFSSITAFTVYHRHKKVNMKPAIPLILAAFCGIITGSYFSSLMPGKILSLLIGTGIIITSMKFFRRKKEKTAILLNYGIIISIIWGLVAGLVLGVVGGGGGVVLLLALTLFLGYPIHEAIGASVFGMTFLALVGASSHYFYVPFSFYSLLVGAIGGILGAYVSAKIANRLSEKKLNFVIGIILSLMGTALLIKGIG